MKKPALLLLVLLCHFCHAQTWTAINSPTTVRINSCSFISPDTGWIVTTDSIYRTNDGGVSWISQNYPPEPAHDIRFFNTVQFINANDGIIGCGNYLYSGNNPALVSTILWTNDGGINWVYKDLGNPEDYVLDAKLANPSVAYAISQYGQAKYTSDSGNTWTDIIYNLPYTGQQLFPLSADTVYFAGSNNISGGGAFGRAYTPGGWGIFLPLPNNQYMLSLFFRDAQHGWISGSDGFVLYTSDAGVSWTQGYTGLTTALLYGIVFTDALKGWSVSNTGKIIHSTDGGLSWGIEYNGTTPLFSIAFAQPGNVGYAVGNNGLVLKYQSPLGTNTEAENFAVSTYPNPVIETAIVNCSDPGNSTVLVYDAAGKELLKQNFSQSVSLDLQALSAGFYFYEIRSSKGSVQRVKFLKI